MANTKRILSTDKSTTDSIDLDFEHYLFEVYLNDRVEHEIQRIMEYEQRTELTPTEHEQR